MKTQDMLILLGIGAVGLYMYKKSQEKPPVPECEESNYYTTFDDVVKAWATNTIPNIKVCENGHLRDALLGEIPDEGVPCKSGAKCIMTCIEGSQRVLWECIDSNWSGKYTEETFFSACPRNFPSGNDNDVLIDYEEYIKLFREGSQYSIKIYVFKNFNWIEQTLSPADVDKLINQYDHDFTAYVRCPWNNLVNEWLKWVNGERTIITQQSSICVPPIN